MAKTNPIHAEITIGEYIEYALDAPLSEFPSDDKGRKAKNGMKELKKIIERGPSNDPLVLEAFDKIEGGLDFDTPFNRLNSQDQSIMEYIREQRKFDKKVPLLSNEKAYPPKRLKAIFGDRTPSPEELNVRYIPHSKEIQSTLSGGTGAAYSPIALKTDYDNFRVAIDVFIDESKKKIKHGESVPDYLVDNRFQNFQSEKKVNRFGSWGLQSAQKTTKRSGIVDNVRMVDYMQTIQNAIEMIDETSDKIRQSSELSDSEKEKLQRLHRETKNAIKLKLATSVRNTDLFGISSIAKEGIYLDAETMKLIGASQKTGGGQILPLSNLGRMAVTEQIAEQRNNEILRIASQENLSLDEAYARFVDNIETGYYDKHALKLFVSSTKDINELATAYLTRAAEEYSTGRVNPVTGRKTKGLGLERYVQETGKKVVDNTLTLSDLRKSLASVIGGDTTLGSKAERTILAQTLLGHATEKDVASTSYIRAFLDDPASDEFLKSQLLLEQRWAEATGKGTVYKLLEDSSTQGIPNFEPEFSDNFARFAFTVVGEDGELVDVTTPDELKVKVGDVVGTLPPAKRTSTDLQVERLISPERQEAWNKFSNEIETLHKTPGSVYENTTPEMRNGHVKALVDFFTTEGQSVDEGIELLRDVHNRGEDITNFSGNIITLGNEFSDKDVLWRTLHEAGSPKHTIEQLLTDKGRIELRDKPDKPKKIGIREQRKIAANTFEKMSQLHRRAELILEATDKYDVDELIGSEIGLDVAAALDEEFGEELSEVRKDPNFSQDAFRTYYDRYNESLRKQGFSHVNRQKVYEWATGKGKAILKTLGIVAPPLLVGAAFLGMVPPAIESGEASARLYDPKSDLSVAEMGVELPETIAKGQKDVFHEGSTAVRSLMTKGVGKLPLFAELTPQDHEDITEAMFNPDDEEQKVINSDSKGLLQDMQTKIQNIQLAKMEEIRKNRGTPNALDNLFEIEKRYEKDHAQLYKNFNDRFDYHKTEYRALQEANKYDLSPVMTRQQREAHNLGVQREKERQSEVDTFFDMPTQSGFVNYRQ